MEWHEAIIQIEPFVVRISTPQVSGTGWLVSSSDKTKYCAIATAAHVINHAHYWEEPIRISHPVSNNSLLLHSHERVILLNPPVDSAGIFFDRSNLALPTKPLDLIPADKYLKSGVEIGWLGFPSIAKAGLCFFSGRISAYIQEDSTYFVDGVAINGVSGGPAFNLGIKTFQLMGIVSAYIPNLATGAVLPGVAVVRDVAQFHGLAESFKSFDDAKTHESPPVEASIKKENGTNQIQTRTPL